MAIDLDQALQQIGTNIRVERVKAGKMTQEKLALDASLARSHVAKIESGEHNVSVRTLIQIANALHIEPAQLLDGVKFE